MTSSRQATDHLTTSAENFAQSADPRPDAVLRGWMKWRVGKRVFDLAVATFLLATMAVIFALVAVMIKLESPGPVFYRARRVGYRGRPLMMLKFRKMHHNAVGAPLTAAGDARLTRIGTLLTQTRLDELPQLWDVLRGRMSIIGPRPEDPSFVALHPSEYQHILSVRPGMTGLSQLAYAEEPRIVDAGRPIEDYIHRIMPQKLTLDQLYADRSSLRLDLAILRWTVTTVDLRRPVSVSRTTGQMNIRHRPGPTSPSREAPTRRAQRLAIRFGRAHKVALEPAGATLGSSPTPDPPVPVSLAASAGQLTAAGQTPPGEARSRE